MSESKRFDSQTGPVPVDARGPKTMAIEQMTTLKMVIGGETVDASDGQTFEVINPATGASIATAPQGGKVDVDKAVAAAQAAFEAPKGWSSWAAGKRGRTLAKLPALVQDHTEDL